MKKFILLITILPVLFGNHVFADSTEFKLAREYFKHNNYVFSSMYAEQAILSDKTPESEIHDLTLIYVEGKKELGEMNYASSFLRKNQKIIPEELVLNSVSYMYEQDIRHSDFEKRLMKYVSLKKQDELKASDLGDIPKKDEILALDKAEGKKTPWVAASLSAIIPGAGQVYNGNYQSAAISFIFNSLLLLTTLEFHREGLDWPAVTSGFLFSMTYFGSIISSGKDARTFNNRVNGPRNQMMKKEFLPELSLRFEF